MRCVSPVVIIFIVGLLAVPAMAADNIAVKVLYPDGSPAVDAPVLLQDGNYTGLGSGTTDASGRCNFTVNPRPGVIRAIVSVSDICRVASVWHDAADASIEIKLPVTNEVSGTIKLDGFNGNPLVVLDDADIFDSSPYDVSRQNGSGVQTFTVNRFSFNTTPGRHVLYAVGYHGGGVYRSDRQEVNVSGSQAPVVLEMKYAGGNVSALPAAVYDRIFHTSQDSGPTSIAGRLLGADGRPLADVTLTAQDYFLRETGSATTGADGAFAFDPMRLGADMVRFKAAINDNGSVYSSLSPFYPAENTSGLEVRLSDYPRSTVGYVYGIIALSADRSNPTPISGTVYLSNGLIQDVSPVRNNGQFFFTLAPGPYDIYAEHIEGGKRLASGKTRIEVEAVWSPMAVNPTILVVQPEKVQYIPLAMSLILGALCILGLGFITRKCL